MYEWKESYMLTENEVAGASGGEDKGSVGVRTTRGEADKRECGGFCTPFCRRLCCDAESEEL